MGYLVNAHKKTIMDHMCGGAALTLPTTFEVALFTTLPAEDGTGGVEATGSGYVRKAVNLSSATNAKPSVVSNDNLLTFAASGGDLTDIVGWGLYLDATLSFVDSFPSLVTILDGESKSFAIGTLTVSLT